MKSSEERSKTSKVIQIQHWLERETKRFCLVGQEKTRDEFTRQYVFKPAVFSRNCGLIAFTLGKCVCPCTAQHSYQGAGGGGGGFTLLALLTVQGQHSYRKIPRIRPLRV